MVLLWRAIGGSANVLTRGTLWHIRERLADLSAPGVSGHAWSVSLARSNYGSEKRQRELAKARKKEEKLQRKLERDKDPAPSSDADEELPTDPD
jgi:hypothetical protein